MYTVNDCPEWDNGLQFDKVGLLVCKLVVVVSDQNVTFYPSVVLYTVTFNVYNKIPRSFP